MESGRQIDAGNTIMGIDRAVFISMVSLCGVLLCLSVCSLFFWLWYCCSYYGPVKSKNRYTETGRPKA
jgi:hypothetical protein